MGHGQQVLRSSELSWLRSGHGSSGTWIPRCCVYSASGRYCSLIWYCPLCFPGVSYPASSTKTDWGCASQCQEPELILLMYPVLNWVVCNLFASYVNSWGRLKLSSCVREATAKYIVLFSFYLFSRCEAKPGLDWFLGSKLARLSNILFFVLCL